MMQVYIILKANDNEMIIIQVDVTPVTSDKSIAIKLERRFFHN